MRLKYGHVIECTGAVKDADGKVTEVQAKLMPDTKSGTPGADTVKVKGVITWVGVTDAVPAEVRLYDRLFSEAQPEGGGEDFLTNLNPDSLKVVTAYVEPSLAECEAGPEVPVRAAWVLCGGSGGSRCGQSRVQSGDGDEG